MTSAAAGFWTSFSKAVLDCVYPVKCPLCGMLTDASPCEPCRSSMTPADPWIVRDPESPLDFRACVFAYDGRAAQAVRRLKYGRSTSLGEFMSTAVAGLIRNVGVEGDLVVPVPLYWGKRNDRGFNQSEILGRGPHGFEVSLNGLRRVRSTRPQAGLNVQERQANLRGAFKASDVVQGHRIILVDDVVTSGQTGIACAGALLGAGATSVGIVAFAGNL